MANWPKEKCRSGLHHDTSVEGGLLHYLGCLPFKERKVFFDTLPRDQEKLRISILEEEERIQRLRNIFEEDQNTRDGKLLASFKTALTTRFKAQGRQPSIPAPPTADGFRGGQQSASTASPVSPTSKIGDLDDLNANVIYFKNHEPYDHPDFKGSGAFPNQKIPLSLLLKKDKKRNPIMWKCEENMIRYFHVPANNMAWLEVSSIHQVSLAIYLLGWVGGDC